MSLFVVAERTIERTDVLDLDAILGVPVLYDDGTPVLYDDGTPVRYEVTA